MTGPERNSDFYFPRFEGKIIQCSPRVQSFSDLLYSKTNGNKNETNISRVTVPLLPSEVVDFARLLDVTSGCLICNVMIW